MKQFLDTINETRKKIEALAKQQEDVYKELLEKISSAGTSLTINEEEMLWEYCHNVFNPTTGESYSREYQKFIEEKLNLI